jgi:hypothetical protein
MHLARCHGTDSGDQRRRSPIARTPRYSDAQYRSPCAIHDPEKTTAPIALSHAQLTRQKPVRWLRRPGPPRFRVLDLPFSELCHPFQRPGWSAQWCYQDDARSNGSWRHIRGELEIVAARTQAHCPPMPETLNRDPLPLRLAQATHEMADNMERNVL